MDEAIKKLESIGLTTVSQETHISLNKLEYILEKKFDLLDKTTAQGFIHILEREYEVDLSEWVEEYNAYLKAEEEENPEEEGVFVSRDDIPRKKNRLFSLFLVLVIVGGVGYYFYTQKGVDFELNLASTSSRPAPKAEEPAAEEKSKPVQSSEESQNESQAVDELKAPAETEMEQPLSEESTPEEIEKPVMAEINVSAVSEEIPHEVAINAITIKPNVRVWVGIVYLDTFEKEDFITEEPIVVNTNREHIMVLGHGDITLEEDDNITQMREKNPVRFHYDGTKFALINVQKFRELNRGEIW